MKLSNKLIIASAIASSCVILLVVFAIFSKNGNLPSKNKPDVSNIGYDADKVQNNISKPLKSTQSDDKYMLRLEDEKICAYMILDDGSLSLWDSTRVPPDLSADDRSALEKGIATDTFEKLCLYFESYAS